MKQFEPSKRVCTMVDKVWQFIPMCNEQHIIGRQYNEIQSHHSHEQERENVHT